MPESAICPACGKPGGWVDFEGSPPGLFHFQCGVAAKYAFERATRGLPPKELNGRTRRILTKLIRKAMRKKGVEPEGD